MYLILNNLEHSSQTINLSLFDTENNPIESVKIKHLFENNTIPVLDVKTVSVAPTQVVLGKEATMILEYTFKNNVLINETETETKIYADSYLKSISAGQANLFKFKTSELTKTEHGELILRLGVGRDHPANNGAFVLPKVYFNDTELVVPNDWRGYDQKTRDRFFGVLEIPVPYDLIDPKLSPDNIVKVVFPDSGGHISSAVLQKFNFSTDVRKNTYKVSMQNQGSKKYISSADENYMICNRTIVDFLEKFEIIGQLGDGNIVSLKGNNGKYISSENGTKTMTCNRTSIGDWEKFTLVGNNGVYALKGNNGLNVDNSMLCTTVHVTDWQKFKFSTNAISFQNQGSKNYISSADENLMICNRTAVDLKEKFDIIGQIGNGNTISIKGSNGKYVSSENGTKTMTCNRTSIGDWEKFTLVGSNGVYALKGNNGQYVRNDMNCTSVDATDWQKFILTTGIKSATGSKEAKLEKTLISNNALVVSLDHTNSQLRLSGIPEGNYKVEIYNTQGKLVKNKNIHILEQGTSLSIDDLSNGLYLLQLNGNDLSEVVKFIKK